MMMGVFVCVCFFISVFALECDGSWSLTLLTTNRFNFFQICAQEIISKKLPK